MEEPLHSSGCVKLLLWLGNTLSRLPFDAAERLAVPLVLGTAFAVEHVRVYHVQARKLDFIEGGTVPVARTLPHGIPGDTRSNQDRNIWNTAASVPSNVINLSPIRLTELIRFPATTQTTVRVRNDIIGLSLLDPRPSIETRHGIRVMSGIVKLDHRKEFDVTVANFSRMDSTLPKNIVIGYAKRNPFYHYHPSP